MTYKDDRAALLDDGYDGTKTRVRCRRVEWDSETQRYRCADCGAGGFMSATDYEVHERASDRASEAGTTARLGRAARRRSPE